MVIDLGGGTVDFSVQETTRTGNMKSIHDVCGGPWGGTRVDEEFIKFLLKLVGADVFTEFKNSFRSEYLELMRILEIKKKQIDSNSQNMIHIKIPYDLFEILTEHTECSISEMISKSPYANSISYLNEVLRFDANFFRSFFESSLKDIIIHLQDILKVSAFQDLLGIVVVGGCADSCFVIDRLKEAFPEKRIIVPMAAGLAVANGAVLFGHNPDVICSRVCRYTYGDDICVPFDEDIHQLSDRKFFNNVPFCNNIFQKFFEKGEKVYLGETRSFSSDYDFRDESRAYQREQPLSIKVYVSNRKDPVYIYDVGCDILGEIVVSCENEKWPETFSCTIEMEIAGTEIQVTAIISTGEKAEAKFNFL